MPQQLLAREGPAGPAEPLRTFQLFPPSPSACTSELSPQKNACFSPDYREQGRVAEGGSPRPELGTGSRPAAAPTGPEPDGAEGTEPEQMARDTGRGDP